MTRYERVLEVAKQLEAAVPAKAKYRGEVARFLDTLRASKELPEQCEWAERAKDEWNVTGKAAKLFEQLEDLVNFHPTVVRFGVYDETNEEEDYEAQVFETLFDANAVGYVQWQIDLQHEQEFYGDVMPDFVWKLLKDGAQIDEGSWDSKVESSWSDSSHSFSRGDDAPGEWKPGSYVVKLSLWDEPLGEVAFVVQEGPVEGAKPEAAASAGRNRYERVADLTKQIEAVLQKTLASRDQVLAHLASIRSQCEKRKLPEHCEWAEEATDEWKVKGAARKLFEQIENLVNFHPKLVRLGFFSDGADPDSTYGRPLTKRFDEDKVRFITWQLEIDHEEEQYGTLPIELRWKYANPDGTTDDEQIMVSRVEDTWGNSVHYITLGNADEPIWKPGRYVLQMSLWDEPFAEASLVVDAVGNAEL